MNASNFDTSMVGDNGRLAGAHRSRPNNSQWEQQRAVRTLAHHAADAAELATFLDMLGLDPTVARRRAA